MDEEKARLFIKIILPLVLILCPVAVVLIGVATYHVLERSESEGIVGALAVIGVCALSFVGAIIYSRRELGWFKRNH